MRLAETDGVPVDAVLVVDASRRTTSLNAYVSGFGSTRGVVIYDTVGHELSHARHDDVLVGTALGALGAALGVGLLGLIVGSSITRGGTRPGSRR